MRHYLPILKYLTSSISPPLTLSPYSIVMIVISLYHSHHVVDAMFPTPFARPTLSSSARFSLTTSLHSFLASFLPVSLPLSLLDCIDGCQSGLQYYENLRMARIFNATFDDPNSLQIDIDDLIENYSATMKRILRHVGVEPTHPKYYSIAGVRHQLFFILVAEISSIL